MSTQVANNWTNIVDQRKISREISREKKEIQKKDQDAKLWLMIFALLTLQGIVTSPKGVADLVWSVLKLADELINKMLRDPTNERNMAEISVVRFLADRGFNLDHMITLPSGEQVMYGDLLTSPEFEELLFQGLKQNYLNCKKYGDEYGLNQKWTNFRIRRFEGETPDIAIRLWFNPDFDPTQIVDLPRKNRHTKEEEKKDQENQADQEWQGDWESDDEDREWQENWESDDDENEEDYQIFKKKDFPSLPKAVSQVSQDSQSKGTSTPTTTFDSTKSLSGAMSDTQMEKMWSKNSSKSWADDDDDDE